MSKLKLKSTCHFFWIGKSHLYTYTRKVATQIDHDTQINYVGRDLLQAYILNQKYLPEAAMK